MPRLLLALVLLGAGCVALGCGPPRLTTTDLWIAPWLSYSPATCALGEDVCTVVDVLLSARDPEHAVVIHVRRDALFISSVVASLLARTVGRWELILVFNELDTPAQAYARNVLVSEISLHQPDLNLVRCRFIAPRLRVSDVQALNMGLRAVSIFADITYVVRDTFFARTRGWNANLSAAIHEFQDVWAVGAQASRDGAALESVSTCQAVAFCAITMSRLGYLTEVGFMSRWGVVDSMDDLLLRAYASDAWKSGLIDLDFGVFPESKQNVSLGRLLDALQSVRARKKRAAPVVRLDLLDEKGVDVHGHPLAR